MLDMAVFLWQVVGYLISTTSQLRVHLSKVAVDKGYRRRGIAKQLIQACPTIHFTSKTAVI